MPMAGAGQGCQGGMGTPLVLYGAFRPNQALERRLTAYARLASAFGRGSPRSAPKGREKHTNPGNVKKSLTRTMYTGCTTRYCTSPLYGIIVVTKTNHHLMRRPKPCSITVRAIVREGKIELLEPVDLPEGTMSS